MSVVEINSVSKAYPRRRGKRILLGRGGLGDVLRGQPGSTIPVLQDINLRVEAGETVGIIGRNGSGKSTLLKIIAGVTLPTAGQAIVRGRVTSLLELGAGFHPMLTGRENIYLNAGILGIRKRTVDRMLPLIMEFSGIEEFIDQPVETYSSGMYVRLGFSVAAFSNADVFLVDEVLSVGDEEFQRKCRRKIAELKDQGKTILFVSHDLGTVNALCDRVVLLHGGRLLSRGTNQATVDYYLRQVGNDAGVHTMRSGEVEVIFNNGRISLFRKGVEVTSASGFEILFQTHGAFHSATLGDWRCTHTEANSCEAEAVLARLPIRLHYRLELKQDLLIWRTSMLVTAPISADGIHVQVSLPTTYEMWICGDRRGTFPKLIPEDLHFTSIVPPSSSAEAVALLTGADNQLPALRLEFDLPPLWTLQLDNSDYMTGARVAQARRLLPSGAEVLAAGDYELASVAVSLYDSPARLEKLLEQETLKRTVRDGEFAATMERGYISCSYAGKLLTAGVHLHTQFHVAHLWQLSHTLRWSSPALEGDAIHATAESARFPLREFWQMQAVESGLQLDVYLEPFEKLEVFEYNVSIGLSKEFTSWRTSHEGGRFSPIPPSQDEWVHINRYYEQTEFVETWADGVPLLRLANASQRKPCRMTAITTGYAQGLYVLQAMYVPEQSVQWSLEPGKHHVASICVQVRETA